MSPQEFRGRLGSLGVLDDCFDFGAFLVGLNGLVVFGLNVRQTQKHFVTTFNFNYL